MKKTSEAVALNLRVPVFYNKRNGQMSVTLPSKKMKKFMKDCPNPKELKISLWKETK
ncbi:MAG: hypothetical protein ACHQ1D_00925 [Nitrososphaerales archaeon]